MSIVIEVRGGCIQAIHSNNKTSVYIIDYDNDEEDQFYQFPRDAIESIDDKLAQRINLTHYIAVL